jgi:hypothetical protein
LGIDKDSETGKYRHVAIHFRTGLAIDDRLSDICRAHCLQLGVEYVEKDLSGLWKPGCRAVGKLPESTEPPTPGLSISASDPYWVDCYDYQDGRGMLFLTYACMEAASRGILSVLCGYQSDSDEEADPDNQDPMALDSDVSFMELMQEVVDNGGFLPARAPTLYAPFEDMGLSKRHILALAEDLGVENTLSCEFSDPPCGLCSACQLRIRGVVEQSSEKMV